MKNVSGETKNSTTGFMDIAGMLPFPVEQSFCRSLKHCSTSSYETVCSWNPVFLSGKEPIRFFSSSLLCGWVVVRHFPVWLKYLFNSFVSASIVLLLGFKIRWTTFQISFEFFDVKISRKMLLSCLFFFFSLFLVFLKIIQFSLLGMLCARNLHLSRCFCNSMISSYFIHGAGVLVNFVVFSGAWRSIQSRINLFSIANWSSGLSKL